MTGETSLLVNVPIVYSRDTQALASDAAASLAKSFAWLASYSSLCSVGYFDTEEAFNARDSAEDSLAQTLVDIISICESRGLDIQGALDSLPRTTI